MFDLRRIESATRVGEFDPQSLAVPLRAAMLWVSAMGNRQCQRITRAILATQPGELQLTRCRRFKDLVDRIVLEHDDAVEQRLPAFQFRPALDVVQRDVLVFARSYAMLLNLFEPCTDAQRRLR